MLRLSAQSQTPIKAYTPIRIPMAPRMITMLPAPQWFVQSAFRCPPAINTQFQRVSRYPDMPCPIRQGSGFPVVLDAMVRAVIVRLLHHSRPAAVAWFVISVYVNAIERVTRRALAHIQKKGLERVRPPFAHLDTSATVIGVARHFAIRASGFSSGPRTIRSGVPLSVRLKTSVIHLALQAPAAFRESGRAFAAAFPHSPILVPLGCLSGSYHREASECLT